MGRKAFYFDMTACIGCKTCQMACKDKMEQDFEPGVFYRHVDTYETGKYPNVGRYNVSFGCNHCENPACVANCPTGAMYKSEDGTVQHDDSVCIGCETCVQSCPYQAPHLIASLGIVHKCDACRDRTAKGENPMCVDACVMRALDFGEYEDLVAKYGNDLVSDLSVLPDSSMTTPNLLVKARRIAVSENAKQMMV